MTVAMTQVHRRRFGAAMDEYRNMRGDEPDRGWRAFILLTTATPNFWERVRPHIDWSAGTVEFAAIKVATADEARLLQVAANLLKGHGAIDVAELADNMNGALWRVVLLAWEEYQKRGPDER